MTETLKQWVDRHMAARVPENLTRKQRDEALRQRIAREAALLSVLVEQYGNVELREEK